MENDKEKEEEIKKKDENQKDTVDSLSRGSIIGE